MTTLFLDPTQHQPPRGQKLILLTIGGICTIGHWGDDCVAWLPLPKVPEQIKEKLAKVK